MIKRSAQLSFDLFDGSVGSEFKKIIDSSCKSYMQHGYGQDVTADAFEAWTVHSYAGDYNPLHDHGCRTEAGLSMILYLKVPECIQKLPDPSELGGAVDINHASGVVDGYTYFTWGNNNMRDVVALRPVTEEYVKPEKGTLIIFPNWLRHSVNPFFGEGERRTFSSNVNIFNNQNFKLKGKSFGEMTAEEKEGMLYHSFVVEKSKQNNWRRNQIVIDYKYDEDKTLTELKSYIDRTYKEHYSHNKFSSY